MQERRKNHHPGESPMATLKQLPALVVLERIPTPVLAVGADGAILFANTAFRDMVGCTGDVDRGTHFREIFANAPAAESILDVVRACADTVVELASRDGSTVRALMSRSALRRDDDQIALVTFQDLTERLWLEE